MATVLSGPSRLDKVFLRIDLEKRIKALAVKAAQPRDQAGRWTQNPAGSPGGKIKHAVLVIGGKRYRGPSHFMALMKYGEENPRAVGLPKVQKEGFETESGHFLDREEAAEYALSQHLVNREDSEAVENRGQLHSEEIMLKAVDGKLYTEDAVMAKFNPSEKRDERGRWVKVIRSDKTWVTTEGAELPAHAKKLGIPPGWQDVHVNADPAADLLARGYDSKGRPVGIYSKAFKDEQARLKFERNRELLDKHTEIHARLLDDIGSDDHEKAEAAACLLLIYRMGLRPGSNKDTKAEKQAYGATTLKAEHVIEDAGGLRLKFVGKKGVDLDLPVDDPELAGMLRERKERGGKLFDVDDDKLRDYTHSVAGGFKVKDFRTLRGTLTAMKLIGPNPAPAADERAYKQHVLTVARGVAAVLGNTPVIALQSYINPFVFEPLKPVLSA